VSWCGEEWKEKHAGRMMREESKRRRRGKE
jgi:hypothetical protein